MKKRSDTKLLSLGDKQMSLNPEANAIRHQHLRTPQCLCSHAHAFSFSRNWCALKRRSDAGSYHSFFSRTNACLSTPKQMLYDIHPYALIAAYSTCILTLFMLACAFCATCNDFFCNIKETIKSNKHFFASHANARLSTPKQTLNDLHSYTLLIALFARPTFYFCS